MNRYGVIGNPVKHSQSPGLHRALAKAADIICSYERIHCSSDDFKKTVTDFFNDKGCGLSVTLPFKEQAFLYADQVTDRAKAVGVASVLKYENGVCIADALDGLSLVSDLQHSWGAMTNRRVLMLGAGGAARGCVPAILLTQPASFCVANRTLSRAQALASDFASMGEVVAVTYAQLGDQDFDVVIHATSIGHQSELLPVPTSIFSQGSVFYDLSYGAPAASFLKWAFASGAKSVCDGLGMLRVQAKLQFDWWHDR